MFFELIPEICHLFQAELVHVEEALLGAPGQKLAAEESFVMCHIDDRFAALCFQELLNGLSDRLGGGHLGNSVEERLVRRIVHSDFLRQYLYALSPSLWSRLTAERDSRQECCLRCTLRNCSACVFTVAGVPGP
jgi:hypothetical protein